MEVGEIFYFTATINRLKHLLKDPAYSYVILDSLQYLCSKDLADVFAFVIMPNHVHLIWRTNRLNGKE